MILGIIKTIFILSLAILFYSKNTNAEYSLKNISTLKKTQYTTLYDGRKLAGNEAMVSLSQGNLNFSGEVAELRINFDYSGTSYDVGLSNFNLSSKFIGNFDTLNSSVTLRPINFLIENKEHVNMKTMLLCDSTFVRQQFKAFPS